ncbi:MAG: hypothetical protein Q4B14_03955, partial [Clostridia bacterium]|nr:hypothetical protein [Clostridia bacterium]
YIKSIYPFTDGHLMISANALADKFFITFNQILPDTKYIDALLSEFEKAGIRYICSGPIDKEHPGMVIPY